MNSICRFSQYVLIFIMTAAAATAPQSGQAQVTQRAPKEQLSAKFKGLIPTACDPNDSDYEALHAVLARTADQLRNLLEQERAEKQAAWASLAPEDRQQLEDKLNAQIASLAAPCGEHLAEVAQVEKAGPKQPVIVYPIVHALAAMQASASSQAVSPDSAVSTNERQKKSAQTIADYVNAAPQPGDGNMTSVGALAAAGIGGKTKLSVDPVSLTFDRQNLGSASAAKTLTITNTGKDTVELIPLLIESKDYAISDNQCDGPIAAGAHCVMKVIFAPRAASVGPANIPLVNGVEFPTLKASLSEDERIRKIVTSLENELQTSSDSSAKLHGEIGELDAAKAAASKKFKDPNNPASKAIELALNAKQRALDVVQATTGSLQEKLRDARAKATTAHDNTRETLAAAEASSGRIPLQGSAEPFHYTFARLVAGLDASAASSKSTSQTYFVDLFVSAPLRLGRKPADALDNRLFIFMDPRITSVPQQGNAASNLNVSQDLFNSGLTQDLKKIVQGLDLSTGLEYALVKPRSGVPWPSFQSNAKTTLSTSFVFGFGASTPFSNSNPITNAQLNQSIKDAYPQTSSLSPMIANVAFVNQDRSRFYRKYYAGFRFKTYYFSRSLKSECDDNSKGPKLAKTVPCEAGLDQFPGMVDLTLGQDEAVTGGRLRRWVLRMDAVYPFPFVPGMHVLGSLNLALAKNKLTTPVTIVNPSATPTDANTFRIPVAPLDRDIFRIGIGMDIEQLIKAATKKSTNAATDAKQANQ